MPVVPGESLRFAQLPGRWSADPLATLHAAGAALAEATGSVSVRVVHIEPGAVRTPHRHPRSPEFIWVTAGSGTAWEDGVTTSVTAGDLVVVPTGVPHATLPGRDGLTLVCFFPDPDLATNREELEGPVL